MSRNPTMQDEMGQRGNPRCPPSSLIAELRELLKAYESYQVASWSYDDLHKVLDALPTLLTALERAEKAEERADMLEELVERARNLAACVFKGETKADYERARHNAAVLANAIDHARQNERNRRALSEGRTG